MPSEPQPRQPKLRASCDRCGLTKLKCDRQQPECGRCVAHGETCVYGISKKSAGIKATSKKSKDSPSTSEATTSTRKRDDSSSKSRPPVPLKPLSSAGPRNAIPPAAPMVDPTRSYNGVVPMDGVFDFMTEVPDLNVGMPADFPLEGFNAVGRDWNPMEMLPATSQPPFSGHNYPSPQSKGMSPPPRYASPPQQTRATSPAQKSDHDCLRDAEDLCRRLNRLGCVKVPATTFTVALENVLIVNREVCTRLHSLLTCACARHPHLALLYASIITQVFTRYQQAASCCAARSASGDAAASTSPALSYRMPHQDGADSRASIDSSVRSSPKMAIGSISIDDHHLQSVMGLQLLLSEVRKAGQVLERFGPSSMSTTDDDDDPRDVESLSKSLNTWLQQKKVRTTLLIRGKFDNISAEYAAG